MTNKQQIIKLKNLLKQTYSFLEKNIGNPKLGFTEEENTNHLKKIKKEMNYLEKLLNNQIKNSKERKSMEESPNLEILDFIKDVKKKYKLKMEE